MNSNNLNKRQDYQRVFSCFDKSQQGKVPLSTFQRCVLSLHSGHKPQPQDEPTSTSTSQSADPHPDDDDISLELEEFVKLVEGGDEADKEKDLKHAFNMYQEDIHQGISPKSLKRMLSLLGHSKTLQDCELMISHFDTNKDGFINYDEFKVMMQQ